MDKAYFKELSKRIYLSPSDAVLDKCVEFTSKIQELLNLLGSIDTENFEIFYGLPNIELSLDSTNLELPAENKEILKSLLDSYELPSLKSS